MARLIKIVGENYSVKGNPFEGPLSNLELNGKSVLFLTGESMKRLRVKKGINVKELASKDGEHLLNHINSEAEVRRADYFSISKSDFSFLYEGKKAENLYIPVEVQFYNRVSN